MARPVSIRSATILGAARKVFLRHGYGASTARIAREAGVSEGLLFKRYGSKCGLFLAAMREDLPHPTWPDRLMASVGAGGVRDALEAAGEAMMRRLRVILPRMLTVRASGVPLAHSARLPGVPPPVRHVKLLAEYFRAEQKRGRLMVKAPEAQAHAFLGALYHYVFCEVVFKYRPISPDRFVRSVVESMLRGIAAAPAAAPARRRSADRGKEG